MVIVIAGQDSKTRTKKLSSFLPVRRCAQEMVQSADGEHKTHL